MVCHDYNLFFLSLSVRERPPAVPEPSQAAVPQTERPESGPLHPGGQGHEFSVSCTRDLLFPEKRILSGELQPQT